MQWTSDTIMDLRLIFVKCIWVISGKRLNVNSWGYSSYRSITNVYLHMWFSTTMWSNFTMQHESRWITMHLSSLGKNDQHLYYTSLNACLPSSDPHLRLIWTTQRIPTHIISHPNFKQRHSSIFTYNKYIVFSCWSWGLKN